MGRIRSNLVTPCYHEVLERNLQITSSNVSPFYYDMKYYGACQRIQPTPSEELVPGSIPGAGVSILSMCYLLNFVIFCFSLTHSQRVSIVIFTCSPTYFLISLCFSFGIMTIRISPCVAILAANCSSLVIIMIYTKFTLKNGYSQLYYTIFIYLTIVHYSHAFQSVHNKGGE